MTTEPSAPRATFSPGRQTPEQAAPGQATQTTTSSPKASVGPIIGAVVTLLLGILLGVTNQAADGVGMGLRVPALLAALLMTGQGVVDLKRHWPKQVRVVVKKEAVREDGTVARTTELAPVTPLPPPRRVAVEVVRPTAPNLAVPITVMVLAAWLGLADLRVEAPTSLTVLCLISAFALFALGWSLLPARR
jgi:hypothetical protein